PALLPLARPPSAMVAARPARAWRECRPAAGTFGPGGSLSRSPDRRGAGSMSATSLAQMPPQAPSRTVLTLGDGVARGGHEHATHQAIAERVAALLGLPCGGDWCEGLPSGSAYLVP